MLTIDTATGLNLILGGILAGVLIFARVFAFALGTAWRRERYHDGYHSRSLGGFGILLVCILSLIVLSRYYKQSAPAPTAPPEKMLLLPEIAVQNRTLISGPVPTNQVPQAYTEYFLQIAALGSLEAAEKLQQQLLANGHDNISIRPPTANAPHAYWRIWLGPFTNHDTALNYQKRYRLKAIIKERTPQL